MVPHACVCEPYGSPGSKIRRLALGARIMWREHAVLSLRWLTVGGQMITFPTKGLASFGRLSFCCGRPSILVGVGSACQSGAEVEQLYLCVLVLCVDP